MTDSLTDRALEKKDCLEMKNWASMNSCKMMDQTGKMKPGMKTTMSPLQEGYDTADPYGPAVTFNPRRTPGHQLADQTRQDAIVYSSARR